ncbi:MAG: heparinase II/III-family protein, partial [Phycisphaerae bacterium]|nr:heparinase II/III-family protein [Phycisphaerae bacterium]
AGARSNHYYSNIVGLAVLGAVLAPYPPATKWAAFAAGELRRETLQQFAPDGFNRECSMTYHRLMVELATLGELACRVSRIDLGPAVRARLAAAYRAIAVLSDSAGNVPLIGDNDSGRIFPMANRDDTDMRYLLALGAAVLDMDDLAREESAPEVMLLNGPENVASGLQDVASGLRPGRRMRENAHTQLRPGRSPDATSLCTALADTGLFVLGDGTDQMVIRCGPLTYKTVNDHNHLDQLSLAVTVAGRQMLVDPGQYCYTPWPQVRNSFIRTHAHNTVVVDDQPQCRMFILSRMNFSIVAEAAPACLVWKVGSEQTHFVGRHRGYRRLPGGAEHERTIVYDAVQRTWSITDRLPLSGRHRLTWRFHLHPDVVAEQHADAWHLAHDGSKLTLRWTGQTPPRGRLEQSWYAPAYGRKTETQVLVFQKDYHGMAEECFILRAQDHS